MRIVTAKCDQSIRKSIFDRYSVSNTRRTHITKHVYYFYLTAK